MITTFKDTKKNISLTDTQLCGVIAPLEFWRSKSLIKNYVNQLI